MNQRSELVALVAALLFVGSAALRGATGVPAGVGTGLGWAGLALAPVSLWMWHREQSASAATRAISRRYMREFAPAMLAYVAAVAGSIALLDRVEAPGLRAVVALLPALPIAYFLRATARYIRDLDELQRRIELEAVALGSVFVTFAYLTAGFLQSARVIAVEGGEALFAALPALTLAYGVAKRVVARHYA